MTIFFLSEPSLLQCFCVRERRALHHVRSRAHESGSCRNILRVRKRQVWRVWVRGQPGGDHEAAGPRVHCTGKKNSIR